MYDYYIDTREGGKFVKLELPFFYYNPKEISFEKKIVPSMELSWLTSVLETATQTRQSMLILGDQGSGKSTLAHGALMNRQGTQIDLACTTTTTPRELQDLLIGGLSTRRRCVFGPSDGEIASTFLDDLQMPNEEGRLPGGSVALQEWVLDLVAKNGFYRREKATRGDMSWVEMKDMTVHAAHSPGRNGLTARLLRYFRAFSLPSMTAKSINRIFGPFLNGFFAQEGFPTAVKRLSSRLIDSTIVVYNEMRAALPPTPSRPHYRYSIHDIARVAQGIMRVKPRYVQREDSLVKLWCHECSRTFHDRYTP